MEVISVGSSSSGNSYIITTAGSTIILDVGLPAKRIIEGLEKAGRRPEDVDAVLITHEHSDHIKSVRAIGRQCPNATFYASRGTVDKTANFSYIDDERIRYIAAGEIFAAENGSAELATFELNHDAAEPLGFTITADGEKLVVVTDCGVITDEIYEAIKDADMLVLESNHDENMLMYGEYPYYLKVRIKSDHGHMSNAHAGETLAAILEDREKSGCDKPLRVMLAHLSFHNNAPYFARQTVDEILDDADFEKDRHYELTIASKDEITIL